MKTCVTCKYHEDIEYDGHKCKKFQYTKVDPVTGESWLQGEVDCSDHRALGSRYNIGGRIKCGPAGIYWEPKEGVATNG